MLLPWKANATQSNPSTIPNVTQTEPIRPQRRMGSLWWGVVHPLIYGISDKAGECAALVHSILSLVLLWLLLFFLFKQKIFLRV